MTALFAILVCVVLVSHSSSVNKPSWSRIAIYDQLIGLRPSHKLYLEYSLSTIPSLTELVPHQVPISSESTSIPEQGKTEISCTDFSTTFGINSLPGVYVTDLISVELIEIQQCEGKDFLGFIYINARNFSKKPRELQLSLFGAAILQFQVEDWVIEVGRVLGSGENKRDEELVKHQSRRRLDSDYDSYLVDKTTLPLELAIAIHCNDPNPSSDYLDLMFTDLQSLDFLFSEDDSYFEYASQIVLTLMSVANQPNLTPDTMSLMYGYTWNDPSNVPEEPSPSALQYVLDQSALYLVYYSSSDTAINTVYESLSEFYSIYSENVLVVDQNPLTGTSSSDFSAQIAISKAKIGGSEISAASFQAGDSTVQFQGPVPFASTQIISIFYLIMYTPSANSESFGIQFSEAGTYSNDVLDLAIVDSAETQYVFPCNTFYAQVSVSYSSSSGGFNCVSDSCTVTSADNNVLVAIVRDSGAFPVVDCSSGTSWNGLFNACGVACTGSCSSCDLEGNCCGALLADYLNMLGGTTDELNIQYYSVLDTADTCLLNKLWYDLQSMETSEGVDAAGFDYFNQIVVNLMDEMHYFSLTGALVTSMNGHFWTPSCKILENPSDSSIQLVVDQSALYITYFDSTRDSLAAVDLSLAGFFSYYSYQLLSLNSDPITLQSSNSISDEIWLYQDTVLGIDLVSTPIDLPISSVTFANPGGSFTPFLTTDLVDRRYIIFYHSTWKAYSFSIHLYNSGTYDDSVSPVVDLVTEESEVQITGDSTIDISVPYTVSPTTSFTCDAEQCTVKSFGSDVAEIEITATGLFMIVDACNAGETWNELVNACGISCESGCSYCDSVGICCGSILQSYITLRDSTTVENAIGMYALYPGADYCLLSKVWYDLKELARNQGMTAAVFDFFNTAVVSLLDPSQFLIITEALVNEIYGYSWKDLDKLLETPYSTTIQAILDQSSLYVQYYLTSDTDPRTAVDSVLSEFFSYYSYSTQSLSSGAITSSTSQGLEVAINIYRGLQQDDSLLTLVFDVDSSAISFSGASPFPTGVIAGIFFVLFESSQWPINSFTIHLYNSGTYTTDPLVSTPSPDTELTLSGNSLDISVTLAYSVPSPTTYICTSPDCTVNSESNGFLSVTTTATGYFTFTDLTCTGPFAFNAQSLDCSACITSYSYYESACYQCVSPCTLCSSDNYCLSCSAEYLPTAGSCFQCTSPCTACSSDNYCTSCTSGYLTSSGSCFECSSPCTQCSSDNYCSECSAGSVPNEGSCYLCGDPCTLCSSDSYCTECTEGYLPNLGACYECTSPCTQCSSDNHCTECTEGYLPNLGGCYECASPCTQCSSDKYCSECSIGYIANEGTCYECSSACTLCSSDNYCSSCTSGYMVNTGSCYLCSSPCTQCSSDNYCSGCLDGYILNTGSCFECSSPCSMCSSDNVCTACISEYTAYQGSCIGCNIDNCSLCESENSCSTCSDGYVLDINACYQCASPCSMCSSDNYCTSCLTGYIADQGKCYQCASPCTMCSSDNYCTSCLTGYLVDNGGCYQCTSPCTQCSSNNYCTACSAGYIPNNGGCILCASPCTLCSSDDYCTSCATNYILNTGKCYLCSSPCTACSSDNYCSSCLTGYIPNNGNCYQCASPCTSCSSDNTCTACNSGYTVYQGACIECTPSYCSLCETANSCTNCLTGYILNANSCFQCSSPCTLCSSNNYCTSCSSGYLANTGSCFLCSSPCTLCSADNYCSACSSGYYLSAGICYACPTACTACSSSTSCTSCTNLAAITAGTCACVASSQMSSSGQCTCLTGYTQVSNTCLQCLRYISQSDIASVSFDPAFTMITIVFSKNIAAFSSCTSLLSSTAGLGTGYSCIYVNSTVAQVVLGSNWSILNGPLVLNGNSLQYNDTTLPCTTAVPSLSSKISHNSTASTPVAAISGPYSLHSSCGSAPSATYSAAGSVDATRLGLIYSWTYTSASPIPNLSSLFSAQNSSTLTFNSSQYLTGYTGSLNITVSTSNVFGESSLFSIAAQVSSSQALSLSMDDGSAYSMNNSIANSFKVSVVDFCGTSGVPSYLWTYLGGNDTAASSALQSLSTTNTLYLAEHVLQPGFFYNFSATAVVSGVSGTAFLGLYVTSLPLVVLVYGNTQHDPSQDLNVSASESYDPNYANALLGYSWTCSLNQIACSGSLASLMLSFQKSGITVPASYLTNLSVLNITVNVSSATQSAQKSINITLNSKAKTMVTIKDPGKLSMSADHYLQSIVNRQGSDSVSFLWSISDSANISGVNFPYIYIKAGDLTMAGHWYTFNLLVSQGGASYTTSMQVLTNIGAVCQYPSISSTTGQAVVTVFELSSMCIDGDGQDYPLYWYGGYMDGQGSTVKFRKSGGKGSKGSIRLPSGNFTALLAVCDSLNDCDFSYFNVTVTNNRQRRLSDYETIYQQETDADPDNIPMFIPILTDTYNLTFDFLEELYSNLTEYEQSQQVKNEELMQSVFLCFSGMINQLQWPSLTTDYVIQVYNYSSQMLQSYNLNISDYTLQTVQAISQNMVSFNTSNTTLLGYSRDLMLTAYSYNFAGKPPGFVNSISLDSTQTSKTRLVASSVLGTPFDINEVGLLLTSLGTANDTQLNILVSRYSGVNEYSDAVEISFSSSGVYTADYALINTNEIAITQFAVPVQVSIYAYSYQPYYSCAYLTDQFFYSTEGCTVTESLHNATANTTLVTFEITHASIFSLFLSNCSYDFAPFAILIIVFFLELFIIPYALLLDNSNKENHEQSSESGRALSKTVDNSAISSPSSLTVRSAVSIIVSSPEIEEISESSVEHDNDEYTIEFKLQPLGRTEKEALKAGPHKWSSILEGHMLFGLVVHRPVFSRFRRVLTLFTTLILQLLLEGLIIKGFENYSSGQYMDTQTVFNNYIGDYLGFAVLAISIAFPVEMFLMIAFSRKREERSVLFYSAITTVVGITIGSFVGVFILAFEFCFQWSGFWAVSFLWSVLIEIFFLQFIYMVVRYHLFREGKLSASDHTDRE